MKKARVIELWTCAVLSLLWPQAASAEHIAINDNRVAAGALAGDTLTLRLEARSGEWHPDGDSQPGVTVRAFAADGALLQVPGPLVRVREGTSIHLVFRNRFAQALELRGFYSRPGPAPTDTQGLLVPGGETRELTFVAGRSGTYYYWATSTPGIPLAQRSGIDTQLSGAFVIDPRGGEPRPDRVLLTGFWNNMTTTDEPTARRFIINGLSWPHTERLAYRVGQTVRLRLINTGGFVHPMHLHGFYFNVDSRGSEGDDTIFPPGSSPHMVVTERLISGATFTLTWKPTRPGNWLFHCHDSLHLEYGGTMDGTPSPRDDPHRHVKNHALEMMSGPILGITVTGKATDVIAHSSAPRRLRLIARVDSGGTDAEPAFAYALEEARNQTVTAAPLPGPAIVLKRGEAVAITVVNELPEATAVHWHGIELESYYDGVAGFAGIGAHIAPAIPPGGSFEARFTPPRAGTFIYHTHIDEVRQQRAGLSGPLLVLDDPSTYDPSHDLLFMVTVPRKIAENNTLVFVNGSATPRRWEMQAGQHYRLRFINLHTTRPSLRMRLLSETSLLTWRAIAKDGRDLPDDQALVRPSEVQMGNGETYDFDFAPNAPGAFRIEVTSNVGALLSSLPIVVK